MVASLALFWRELLGRTASYSAYNVQSVIFSFFVIVFGSLTSLFWLSR